MKCHEFMEYVCMFVLWCLRRERGVGVGGCGGGERAFMNCLGNGF